jgi:fructoselysine-6-P-deglycase FrlB-like protein
VTERAPYVAAPLRIDGWSVRDPVLALGHCRLPSPFTYIFIQVGVRISDLGHRSKFFSYGWPGRPAICRSRLFNTKSLTAIRMKDAGQIIMRRRKEDFSQIPRALEVLLEKSASELRSSLRSAPPGEGPVLILCRPAQIPVAWTAVWAFENLMGRPAMIRTPAVLEQYSIHAVGARSTILVLPGAAETQEALQALKRARNHGAIVWAFAGGEETALMRLAHGVLPAQANESNPGDILSAILAHVRVVSFAVNAARMLRPPSDAVDQCERGLSDLGRKIEWSLSNLQDAATRFGEELRRKQRIMVAGGGPFHAAALQAALGFREGLGVESAGVEVTEMATANLPYSLPGGAVMFLSSSRCRIKKQIQEAASRAKIEGAEILSITDSEDRELVARAARSILVPSLPEIPGALMALTVAEWVAALQQH